MPQVPTVRSIKKKAWFYSCDSIPVQLLESILSYFDYNIKYEDKDRIGITGFPKRAIEKYNTTREKLIKNPYEALDKCSEFLRDALYHVRINFPEMNILEWYLTTVSCYGIGGAEPIYIMRDETINQTWEEYKNNGFPSSKFAEEIILNIGDQLL
jgi:hypothetical protein